MLDFNLKYLDMIFLNIKEINEKMNVSSTETIIESRQDLDI